MSNLTAQIISKLQRLEAISEPSDSALQSIFDYVCFFEERLDNKRKKTEQLELEAGYRAMAADTGRESEALAWSEALMHDSYE
ncbi:hypothetical protein [[Limnothrix rosea] IAM M-220]|uniref:hypothetical protein n=1 Tax=[Limnothrix rosea] IAM M-220 TaxID=454133 RepID=UPI000966B1B8|nr:hypothetical protein [[Limnothrix rosea] IAM M-220]OKH19386.1 hypothetical protein NIES208_02410 [[Limnothrix rosea] IAM M-220]